MVDSIKWWPAKAVRGFSLEKAVAATEAPESSARLQMKGQEGCGPAVGQGRRFGVVGDAAVPCKGVAAIRVAVDLHLRAPLQGSRYLPLCVGRDVFVFFREVNDQRAGDLVRF